MSGVSSAPHAPILEPEPGWVRIPRQKREDEMWQWLKAKVSETQWEFVGSVDGRIRYESGHLRTETWIMQERKTLLGQIKRRATVSGKIEGYSVSEHVRDARARVEIWRCGGEVPETAICAPPKPKATVLKLVKD